MRAARRVRPACCMWWLCRLGLQVPRARTPTPAACTPASRLWPSFVLLARRLSSQRSRMKLSIVKALSLSEERCVMSFWLLGFLIHWYGLWRYSYLQIKNNQSEALWRVSTSAVTAGYSLLYLLDWPRVPVSSCTSLTCLSYFKLFVTLVILLPM